MGSLAQPAPTTRHPLTPALISLLTSLLPATTTFLTPSSPGYPASIARWSSAAIKPAGACLLPTSSAEIAIALRFASEHDIDVAVKGGGHSTAGASSTDGGLLIDLGNMRNVVVDKERRTVKAQGGATWGDVDAESVKYGLCTVGGTVSDTGVGGLTLGGGYGWLSGERGLVIDNLVECEMVLADGRVVRIAEEEEEELFWAIRGAGQNFGVATSFTYRAFEVPESGFWAGMLMFPAVEEVVGRVVEVLNRYYTPGHETLKGRMAGGLVLAKPPPANGMTLVLVPIIYRGTEEEGKVAFKELLELNPVMSTMAMVGYEVVNTILAAPVGMRVSMKGSSFQLPIRAEFVGEVLRSFDTFVERTPDAAASMVFWEMYDPTAMVTKSTGGSFANRGFHLNSMIAPFWTDQANDTVCRQWARDVAAMFKEENKRWGVATGKNGEMKGKHGAVMIYGNYDQYDEKARDVFGDHYPRLQELKKRYDPGNVFNKLFAITPA